MWKLILENIAFICAQPHGRLILGITKVQTGSHAEMMTYQYDMRYATYADTIVTITIASIKLLDMTKLIRHNKLKYKANLNIELLIAWVSIGY